MSDYTAFVTLVVKNLPAMQETWVRSLSPEDPLEKGMVPIPGLLPGGVQGQKSLTGYVVHRVTKSQT